MRRVHPLAGGAADPLLQVVRVIQAVGERLGIPRERCIVNIERYGNTSAASIPIALDEAVRDGRVKRGDLILFTAFGAGLTWGAALVRW